MKLEPFGRKSVFVGYNETSKAYRIYTPRQQYVEVSQDVIFEEDLSFRRSQEIPTGGEEKEASKVEESTIPFNTGEQPSDHEESEEDEDPVDPPSSQDTIPKWLRETLKDVKRHTNPKNTHRERIPLERFGSYVALMSNTIDFSFHF